MGTMLIRIVAASILGCFVSYAAAQDTPASVMAYKVSGRMASPVQLFHTNLVAGSNIVLEFLTDGKTKIHGTGGGGTPTTNFISSVDPDFFDVVSGELDLTNSNLINWSKYSTNEFASQTQLNSASNSLQVQIDLKQPLLSQMGTSNATHFPILWGTNIAQIQQGTNIVLYGTATGIVINAGASTPIASANITYTSLLNSTNPAVVKTVSGSANITVSDQTTNVALDTIQGIQTNSTPQFAGLAIGSALNVTNLVQVNATFGGLNPAFSVYTNGDVGFNAVLRIGTNGPATINGNAGSGLQLEAGITQNATNWLLGRFGSGNNKLFLGDDGTNTFIEGGHTMQFQAQVGGNPRTGGSTFLPALTIYSGVPSTGMGWIAGNAPGLTNIPVTGLWGSGGTNTPATNGISGQVATSAGNGGMYWSTSASGTVTSVGLVAPSIFGVTNSPITSSGNLGFTNVYQTANTVYSGPSSGSAAEPTFRALVAADLPATFTNSVGITVDGGGTPITTGQKGFIQVPYTGTIRGATIMADVNGTVTFDVWKTNSTGFPPTVTGTITASAKPTITATNWSTTSLTSWITNVTAGDFIGWNVDSASTCTRVTLQLAISH